MFVPPRYSEAEARSAIAASTSFSAALRKLGLRAAGGNWRTLRKYAAVWSIPTDHFDPNAARKHGVPQVRRPLSSILVEGSSFSRWHLKNRLFEEGIKERRCELCGQDELWRGRRMALILDHINGIADDHRLENLQIVCPNCAATLDTHCGKLNRRIHEPRDCPQCAKTFQPKHRTQRYCCRACGHRYIRGLPAPERRKVARPPYTHLVREVNALGYLATGRRYGVSDNAIRKWLRQYERERERQSQAPQLPLTD
jgi:hypothetical protein